MHITPATITVAQKPDMAGRTVGDVEPRQWTTQTIAQALDSETLMRLATIHAPQR